MNSKSLDGSAHDQQAKASTSLRSHNLKPSGVESHRLS